jgi:hypothetical protein
MRTTSTTARPRAWRLQFSLRLLLFAITAFGIGFPIWYRWPYEETLDERDPTTGALGATRITTWQRQWGGHSLKHGVERLTIGGGKSLQTIESTTYRDGLRHGPYQMYPELGEGLRGQYVDDKKEGVWVAPDRTSTWHRGKLDGPYEIRFEPLSRFRLRMFPRRGAAVVDNVDLGEERIFHLDFAAGRLTSFNGKPAVSRLFDLLETDAIDSQTSAELKRLTEIDIVEMPLQDTAIYLADKHNIPIVLDSNRLPNIDLPLTDSLLGIDLCSALTLLTAPHDLGCDYRYGCVWITTAEDAKDWHDPTGVADIEPPKGSALGRAWNEPAAFDAVNMPLADALAQVVQRLAIEIDATRLAPSPENPTPICVTASVRGLPFRHVLGQLLYNSGCRCKLEGDKLVILPPEM